MSSPILPWSSSPDSHHSAHEDVLTPSRRVKALLAQFSDSDSDREEPSETRKAIDVDPAKSHPNSSLQDELQSADDDHEEEDEDDVPPLAPRGRLAARLQGLKSGHQEDEASVEDEENAYSRVRKQLQRVMTDAATLDQTHKEKMVESSGDELLDLAPRQRFLKRKSSPISQADRSSVRSRSASPLFFPSPSLARRSSMAHDGSSQPGSDQSPGKPVAGGNAKFLALVEKHRRQRLAKEAAEIAKKAARTKSVNEESTRARGPRGSSPADESGEDSDASDDGAAKSLTQDARPARKASKKALEEMNRETQRMSRNMQLAHQARTRKKITKESFLARFNFPISGAKSFQEDSNKSTTASSAPTSDVECTKEHATPPTSPLQEGIPEKVFVNHIETRMDLDQVVFEMRNDDFPSVENPLAMPSAKLDKGKGKGVDSSLETEPIAPTRKDVRPIRVKWSKEDAVMARAADSDSDLEIITSHANTRKFAAFESLPKRSVKENESHLVLRSLAHLIHTDDRKRSSMNAAEMEISLRKAAREQARRERQEKIEELKAKGVVIQTVEEREREQQEVEDLVERARREAAEIQKREEELAKKDGTFVKDGFEDDSDDEDDADFQDEEDVELAAEASDSDEEEDAETEEEDDEEEHGEDGQLEKEDGGLIDQEADEQDSDEESEEDEEDEEEEAGSVVSNNGEDHILAATGRKLRNTRVIISDDEEDDGRQVDSPSLPAAAKTPQSLPRSARKIIPGLQMSDDLPMGLTQAFAATMADSQTQDDASNTQEQDTFALVRDLPSPELPFAPKLNRLDSIDIVSDSQPASQTQGLNINLSFSQSQRVPQSPVIDPVTMGPQYTPSQLPFEPTQDAGYMFSPFAGRRFDAATPQQQAPHSTVDTIILPDEMENSPIMQRKGRLRRGRATSVDEVDELHPENHSAFEIMHRAAKEKSVQTDFDKSKSAARDIVDEAAEESEDEYAGLGGASDDDAGEENEDDRKMIDEDTQVGRGDELKLAGLFADRERKQDEAAVSKLLKDITTGALRRKRGVGDDLDLSDEEDAAARRREAKRREFAKMRRELLKDEAVGKIAEDRKKEAFLRSIEDREEVDDEDLDFDGQETPLEDESQPQSQLLQETKETQTSAVSEPPNEAKAEQKHKRPLEAATNSTLNRLLPNPRRTAAVGANKRPSTLAEIRETVSFLIEEPSSQPVDLGLSDSEEEPEAYVNLDRHLEAADENSEDDDAEDLGDFIVDDDGQAEIFKKPEVPRRHSERASFSERRTKQRANVVDRLQLLRQASSSSASSTSSGGGSSSSTKTAFYTNKSGSTDNLFGKVPSLLRRATSNSSFGSKAGRGEEVSSTGVVTASANNRTERGSAEKEKEFIRKGTGGRRNAVNYTAREKPADAMSRRAGVVKNNMGKGKRGKGGASGFLGGLFRGNSWE